MAGGESGILTGCLSGGGSGVGDSAASPGRRQQLVWADVPAVDVRGCVLVGRSVERACRKGHVGASEA